MNKDLGGQLLMQDDVCIHVCVCMSPKKVQCHKLGFSFVAIDIFLMTPVLSESQVTQSSISYSASFVFVFFT